MKLCERCLLMFGAMQNFEKYCKSLFFTINLFPSPGNLWPCLTFFLSRFSLPPRLAIYKSLHDSVHSELLNENLIAPMFG
ncbi:hypothetical protein L204_100936 [Cryptococcus depauperatus]